MKFIFPYLVIVCVIAGFGLGIDSYLTTDNWNVNRTVDEGMNLTVQCNTSIYSPDDVFWVKDDFSYHSNGEVLELENITRYDMGFYTCQAFDRVLQDNVTLENLYLDVWYKSDITYFNITPNIVIENESYTFHFEVDSNPPGLWYLRKYGSEEMIHIAKGVGRLSYGPVLANCSDMGDFELMALNGIGVMSSVEQNLTVLCTPRPSLVNYVVHGSINSTAALLMNAIGFPFPNYTWTRQNGMPIPFKTQTDFDQLSLLNISVSSIDDFTNYTCTMTNYLGSYTATYQLTAIGAPESPYNLTISNITDNSAVLYWTSGYDMGESQSFYLMRNFPDVGFIQISEKIPGTSIDHGVGHTWSHNQENLDSNTDITLSVIAVNNFGLYSKLALPGVTFRTLPAPPTPESEPINDHHGVAVIVLSCLGSACLLTVASVALVSTVVRKRKRIFKAYEAF